MLKKCLSYNDGIFRKRLISAGIRIFFYNSIAYSETNKIYEVANSFIATHFIKRIISWGKYTLRNYYPFYFFCHNSLQS